MYFALIVVCRVVSEDRSLDGGSGIATRVPHDIAIRRRRSARTLGRRSPTGLVVLQEMLQKSRLGVKKIQPYRLPSKIRHGARRCPRDADISSHCAQRRAEKKSNDEEQVRRHRPGCRILALRRGHRLRRTLRCCLDLPRVSPVLDPREQLTGTAEDAAGCRRDVQRYHLLEFFRTRLRARWYNRAKTNETGRSPTIYPEIISQRGDRVVGNIQRLNGRVDTCVNAVEAASAALGPSQPVEGKTLAKSGTVLGIPIGVTVERRRKDEPAGDENENVGRSTRHDFSGGYPSDSTALGNHRAINSARVVLVVVHSEKRDDDWVARPSKLASAPRFGLSAARATRRFFSSLGSRGSEQPSAVILSPAYRAPSNRRDASSPGGRRENPGDNDEP